MFYVSLAIAVAGLSVYHLALKRVPKDVNPFVFLAIGYMLAAVLCVASARIAGGKMPWQMVSSPFLITLGMLAVGVLLIEIGVLLAYRYDWPLGTVGPVSNALAAVVLVPVAVLFFKDHLSRAQLIGMVLVITGMILMTRRTA